MVNSLNDGLSDPTVFVSGAIDSYELGSPIRIFASGNSTFKSLNGQVMDFGVFTGSGNTSVISYAKTFSAAPNVKVWYTLGSVAEASSPVLSAIGTGSFSCAAGSNLAFAWEAIGSGTY